MNSSETLTLIHGSFSHDEAQEILLNLFTSKIRFHRLRNWSMHERLGQNDETAQTRLAELKQEMEKLQTVLARAKAGGHTLSVRSQINITLTDG